MGKLDKSQGPIVGAPPPYRKVVGRTDDTLKLSCGHDVKLVPDDRRRDQVLCETCLDEMRRVKA